MFVCVFYLVIEDAHCVQSVEVLLQQGSSSRVQVDFIQLQHSYCHPEQSFVHGRLLQAHTLGIWTAIHTQCDRLKKVSVGCAVVNGINKNIIPKMTMNG